MGGGIVGDGGKALILLIVHLCWLNDQGKQLVDDAVNYIKSELSGGIEFYEFRCTGGYVPFGFYGLTVYYQFK